MKNAIRNTLLITALSLGAFAVSSLSQAAASSYKWTDAQGNVHYSQTPPRDKDYEKIKNPKHYASPPAKTPAPSNASGTGAGSGSGNKSGEKVLQDELARNEEQRKKNCEAAKNNLKAYSIYRKIKQPDGKIVVLTDKERAERKARAEEAVKDFCD